MSSAAQPGSSTQLVLGVSAYPKDVGLGQTRKALQRSHLCLVPPVWSSGRECGGCDPGCLPNVIGQTPNLRPLEGAVSGLVVPRRPECGAGIMQQNGAPSGERHPIRAGGRLDSEPARRNLEGAERGI